MKSFVLSVFLIFLLTIIQSTPTPIEADTPSGFFPIGPTYRLGNQNVYFVNSASEFRNIANDPSGIYLIMNNIDMNGTHIENLNAFSGIIHGFGRTISNMRYDNDQLIATTNNGVLERLNFTDISIDSTTSTSIEGLLFSSNNGRISDLSLEISNSTNTAIIPPLVNENLDRMLNMVVNYDITSDINEDFVFYTGLSSTDSAINNVWMQGDVNVSTTGVFDYRSMGSNDPTNYCVDDINVTVNTATSINNAFGSRCNYTSNDSTFDYNGEAFEINAYDELADRAAVISLLNSRFDRARWNAATRLSLIIESRYNLAGEHVYQLENVFGSTIQLNLFRSPEFNSASLDYTSFRANSIEDLGVINEEVTYSTNYSRVFINDKEASLSQTIEQFGPVNLRLESDYNLPTLEVVFDIQPELNFFDGMEVLSGFVPRASVGSLTLDGRFLASNEAIDLEGEYLLELTYGSEVREYVLSVFPAYSGVSPDQQRTDGVTPIITASSVTINGEPYNRPQTFTEIGSYEVVFANTPSYNFSFEIIPALNRVPIGSDTIAERISLQSNFEELKINGQIYDDQFIASQPAIVHATGSTIELNLPYGRHVLEMTGLNDFQFIYEIENEPEIIIDQDAPYNPFNISVNGGVLYVNDDLISTGNATYSLVGNYDVEIRYFSDGFNLDANETIIDQTYTVDPFIGEIADEKIYQGRVTPSISGSGMTLLLNGDIIDIADINQTFDVPGNYELEIQGFNQYLNVINFTVQVSDSLEGDTFYNVVNLSVSSPNNTVYYRSPNDLYPNSEESFDYEMILRRPGEYVIETESLYNESIEVTRFEILPVAYRVDTRDDYLAITINELHPDVQIIINQVVYSATNNLEFTAAGAYNLSFDSSQDDVVFDAQTYIITPQIEPTIIGETDQVNRYKINNDIEEFYINGRRIENEVFLQNQEFTINQNGENVIRIVGAGNHEFEYISNFNNPHFNNVTRLSIFAILTGLIGLASIVGRYLLAVRHDN